MHVTSVVLLVQDLGGGGGSTCNLDSNSYARIYEYEYDCLKFSLPSMLGTVDVGSFLYGGGVTPGF